MRTNLGRARGFLLPLSVAESATSKRARWRIWLGKELRVLVDLLSAALETDSVTTPINNELKAKSANILHLTVDLQLCASFGIVLS